MRMDHDDYDAYDAAEDETLARLRELDAQSEESTDEDTEMSGIIYKYHSIVYDERKVLERPPK